MAIKSKTLKILNYFVIIFIQKKGKNMKIKELIKILEKNRIEYGDNIQVVVDIHKEGTKDKPIYCAVSDTLNSSPTEETVVVLCY